MYTYLLKSKILGRAAALPSPQVAPPLVTKPLKNKKQHQGVCRVALPEQKQAQQYPFRIGHGFGISRYATITGSALRSIYTSKPSQNGQEHYEML
jgi:hypothetical protein